jgi:hypothetical protein
MTLDAGMRPLDERLALRCPHLARLLFAGVMALPPGSPVRRRALKRFLARGFQSFSRGDVEGGLLISDPELEVRLIGWEGLGLSPAYHGHDGWRALTRDWLAQWENYELKPVQLLDAGDRLIVRTTATALGAHSGAEVAVSVGHCYYFTNSTLTRYDIYREWSALTKALQLAGSGGLTPEGERP